MEYFIFYIKFEEKIMPIYCTGIGDDPIVEDHYLFTGVKHLDDKAFPALKVHSISLPKGDIKYYLKGTEEEMKNKLEEAKEEEPVFEDEDFMSEDSSEEEPEPIKPPSRRRGLRRRK